MPETRHPEDRTPKDRPGARPLLVVGAAAFDAWRVAEPAGHALLLGPHAAIHRVDCSVVGAATGRVAVCSPDTLALQLAMYRFEGQVVACADCRPAFDAPAQELGAAPERA